MQNKGKWAGWTDAEKAVELKKRKESRLRKVKMLKKEAEQKEEGRLLRHSNRKKLAVKRGLSKEIEK